MTDIITLENVCSPKDINWLVKSMDSINYKNVHKRSGSNILKVPKGELRKKIDSFICNKLQNTIPNCEIHTVNFYDIVKPYGMHSDTVRYNMQGIIPLEFIGGDAYTLVYDQTANTNIEWMFEKPADYKPFFNKPVKDASTITGWSPGQKIPDQDGIKYWKDQWRSYYKRAYEGFSIKHSYKWNIGDIFLFHSKYLHSATCSQSRKKGIMFCLT